MKRSYKVRWQGVKSLDMDLSGEGLVKEGIHVPLRGTKPGLATIRTPCHLHWTSSSYRSSSCSRLGSKQHAGLSEMANGSSWVCEDRPRKAVRTCSEYDGVEAGVVAQ